MSVRFKHAVWMLVPAIGLTLPALTQAAAEPRYTYAEVGYINVDFDDINEDGDGFLLGGSYAIHKSIHLLADYQDIDLSGNNDANALSLGAGVNLPLRPGLDFVGRLRWIDVEVDVGNQSDDADGYGLEIGLRTMINPQLELNGAMRYVDLDDEDDTSVVIGALYGITDVVALGGDIELSDDVTALYLKARFYFGAPAQIR